MRWHTEECMCYAAETGKPWCIIDCADMWRAFIAKMREELDYATKHYDASAGGVIGEVIEKLDIEEEVNPGGNESTPTA